MILSSLPLKMSVSYRNRTYNRVLGGPRYIHLTKGTNAVFSGFSAFSVTATNFMNSITFVMNHLISYFDISICHCSNRTLCYHLFKFHGFNYGYFLGGVCSIQLSYMDVSDI